MSRDSTSTISTTSLGPKTSKPIGGTEVSMLPATDTVVFARFSQAALASAELLAAVMRSAYAVLARALRPSSTHAYSPLASVIATPSPRSPVDGRAQALKRLAPPALPLRDHNPKPFRTSLHSKAVRAPNP